MMFRHLRLPFRSVSSTLDQLSKSRIKMQWPYVRKIHTEKQDFRTSKSDVIFSGIQPTGAVHLGNYLGAVRNWTIFQENCDSLFCIVDMHSITLPYDHKELHDCIMKLAATLIACGIDPKKCILYQQSRVLEHANLCWILTCLSTMPRLSRFPQFKDKSATFTNTSVPTGLFLYPVLQTADILLYKTTHVPVGDDQASHINLASDLAKLFNGKYGDTFPIPKSIIFKDSTGRIKSLRDPSVKMSKSEKNPKSRIEILDSPDTIREHIKKSMTDFTSEVYYDPETRPGVSNLMTIHHALTGQSYENIQLEVKNLQTSDYKMALADIIIEYLKPIRTKAFQLLEDKHYLTQVLNEGSDKARARAHVTLKEVYAKIGF